MNAAYALAAAWAIDNRGHQARRDSYAPPDPAHLPTVESVDTRRLPETSVVGTGVRGMAAAIALGFLASFSVHLVNLRMQSQGYSGAEISFSLAAQAMAICSCSFLAHRLVARVGFSRTLPYAAI